MLTSLFMKVGDAPVNKRKSNRNSLIMIGIGMITLMYFGSEGEAPVLWLGNLA